MEQLLLAENRILQEYHEIESNPSNDFKCGPSEEIKDGRLERNIFDWQFAVRGASGTEFEGGIYHGRILFPREYPFKPPLIIPLTENGRFETHTKIRLGRLNEWRPSWRVRDVFVDFIHLMPIYPDSELASLEYNKEKRRTLANKSREAATKYGTTERQNVIDQIHQYMLSKAPTVPQLSPVPSQASNGTGGGSVVYNVSTGGGSVVYNVNVNVNFIGNAVHDINGNAFQATNSSSVGILGSMNRKIQSKPEQTGTTSQEERKPK